MRRAALPLVLGLIGLGLLFTSVAMAAPSQPAVIPLAAEGPFFNDPITETETMTDTDTISETIPMTHPVASAIADFFEVDYSEIADLHEQGYGFGVIAHAYFTAEKLTELYPDDPVYTETLLALFDGGMGWGEIMKEYDLHPGQAVRGGNLGSIMSNRRWDNDGSEDTWMPPGQLKKDGEDGDNVPPGQLKKTDDDDGDDVDRGGPPDTPPGQSKDKDKGKGKK